MNNKILFTEEVLAHMFTLIKQQVDSIILEYSCDSLLELWKENGNTGELQDFLNWVKADVGGYNGEVGEIYWWSKTAPPNDSLICDGSEISREEYQELWETIGTTFGNGDGETTFNLPDLKGQFIRGFDPSATRDPQGTTRGFGSHQQSTQHPLIRTAGTPPSSVHTPRQSSAPIHSDGQIGDSHAGRSASTLTATTTSIGTHYTSRPTNINLLPCIRYKSNSKNLENRIKELEKIVYDLMLSI